MAYEGGDGVQLSGPTPESRLLDTLRRRAAAPGLRFASSPVRVTGGFWAEIWAVRLEGGGPDMDGDVIVRVMPDNVVARREMVVQSEVVRQGFSAPRVRLTGEAADGLGRPFMVMDRAPGLPPIPAVTGVTAMAAIGRAAIRLPDLMARTSARLHALDPAPLRSKLEGLDDAVVDVGDLLSVLAVRAGEADRPDLERAVRRPVRAAARQGARQFLRRYRQLAPGAETSLADDMLQWYSAVHCLRALVELAGWIAAGTANDRAGHPWLVMAPQMAVRLTEVVGHPVRPM